MGSTPQMMGTPCSEASLRGGKQRMCNRGKRGGTLRWTGSICDMVARGPIWADGLGLRLFVVLGGGTSVWPTVNCDLMKKGVYSIFNPSYWL
jgi:hypothetical protein